MKLYIRKILSSTHPIIIGLILQSLTLSAQTSSVNQQWIQYFNQLKLSPKFSLNSDGGLRWKYEFREPSQYLTRTGIYFHFSKRLTLGAGIANSGYFTNTSLSRIEFRPYQELVFKHHLKSLKIQHRIRVEERIFHPYTIHELQRCNQYVTRFRYRLLWNIPLFEFKKSHYLLLLNIANEVFFNAGKSQNIFDQNRILIGPTLKISDSATFSLMYNCQYNQKNSERQYDHVIWLGMTHQLQLSNNNDKHE